MNDEYGEWVMRDLENGDWVVLDSVEGTRTEWGVMFNDGSVGRWFHGRTAEKRCRQYAANRLREQMEWIEETGSDAVPDNIRVVSRKVYVGDWGES